ncbi:MAG: hypothetical protein ACKOY8_08790 [Verrucomicrobiota bacterium]
MAKKAKQDSDDGAPAKVTSHTVKLDAGQAAKLRGILAARGW